MYVLRQIGSALATGVQTQLDACETYNQQLTDINSRYIMVTTASGQTSGDFAIIPASGSFSIPLPQNYDTTQRLYCAFATTQTVQVFFTSPTLGAGSFMLQAGASSDQQGIATFCGLTTSLSITNPQASATTVEWFLFQLPNITQPVGWRDGAMATGSLGVTGDF